MNKYKVGDALIKKQGNSSITYALRILDISIIFKGNPIYSVKYFGGSLLNNNYGLLREPEINRDFKFPDKYDLKLIDSWEK